MDPLPSDPAAYWQAAYWNRVAAAKTFTHPLDTTLLAAELGPQDPILDVGCGYGRLVSELRARGFDCVVGVDTAEAMVARGRARAPELDLRAIEPGPLPFDDASFAAVLLFSVLTCIPGEQDARGLVDEIHRVVRPGGLVLASDLSLQTDARNRARYEQASALGVSGVFTLPEGVVLRHYERGVVEDLFADFELVTWNDLDVRTMNGHRARAFQLAARRPA